MNAVDLEHLAERVEVGVARLLERVPHVDRTVTALEVALEEPAVERPAAGTEHPEVRRRHALFERRHGDGNLERRAGRVPPLQGAVLHRFQLAVAQRLPLRRFDTTGELVRVEGGQARERQHFARTRIEDDRGAVEAVVRESLFGRPLDVGVDRQLDAPALDRAIDARLIHLAAAAVDEDQAVAVLAHQQLVVRLLDARLPHHRPGFGAGILGPRQIGFARLADVTEEVRAHLAPGILSGRHFLRDDPRQFEAARLDGNDLLQGRVLDQHDRPVARFTTPAVDGLAHLRFVGAGGRRHQAKRVVDIARLLAVERDVEGVLILDQDLAVAVEQDAARRRQRQPAAVVVLRHLVELLVLRDLKHPERHRQRGKERRHEHLHPRQPQAEVAAVVGR